MEAPDETRDSTGFLNADLASPQEVLHYLTAIMRGVNPLPQGEDPAGSARPAPSTSERMKAAELLGKRYRLFSETAPQPEALPVIVDDIAGGRQP